VLPAPGCTAGLVVAGGASFEFATGSLRGALRGDDTAPSFVGSEACAGCHRAETDAWRTSQHSHAMDHATAKTVLGDFNDASFEHYGVRSRFFRKDGKFLVETDRPDGKLAPFEVQYTL